MVSKPPTTAKSLWERYAPEWLIDLLALPDDGNEIVTTDAPLFYANGLVNKTEDMATFYKPDQKRKAKGNKGGGQFLETNAELKHQAEQSIAQGNANGQYMTEKALEQLQKLHAIEPIVTAEGLEKAVTQAEAAAQHAQTGNPLTTGKPLVSTTGTSKTTVAPEGTTANDIINLAIKDLGNDSVLLDANELYFATYSTVYNVAQLGIRVGDTVEFYSFDYKGSMYTDESPDMRMTYLEAAMMGIDKAHMSLSTFPGTEYRLEALQGVRKALQGEFSLLWDAKAAQGASKPPVSLAVSDQAKAIIKSGQKPQELQFLELSSSDKNAIIAAAGHNPADYQDDYSWAWENLPQQWAAYDPDAIQLDTPPADNPELEAQKKKLAQQYAMLAKAEVNPHTKPEVIAKLKALISGGEHNLSMLTSGYPPPAPKPVPMGGASMTTAWGKVYPKDMVDKLQEQIYKPTLHPYPDPENPIDKKKWEQMVQATVDNHGIDVAIARAQQAVDYLSENLAYQASMGIPPSSPAFVETNARLKFYDAGLQRLKAIQGGTLPALTPEELYPGTTLLGKPVAPYGTKKDQAKKDMQAAFDAYNQKSFAYGQSASDEAKKLYTVYQKLAEEYNQAYSDYAVAVETDPKFTYETLVSELKGYYAGLQSEDTDLAIKTNLAAMERYERIHGLKRPKLPTTYKNPKGYKKGQQQTLDLGLTVDDHGSYTKLGLVDKSGNVIDPARFDPAGLTFADYTSKHYVLAEQFKEWHARLTAEQRETINGYMGSDYDSLNYELRHGSDPDYLGMVKPLDAIFAHKGATAPESMIVWRGGRISEADVSKGTPTVTNDFNITEGDVVLDPGYVSTSLSRSTAMGFQSGDEKLFQIELPKGLPAAYIATVGGAGETELLLPRNSLFLVMGESKTGNNRATTRLRYLGTQYNPNDPAITGYDVNTQLPPGWYTPWDAEKGEWAGPQQFPGWATNLHDAIEGGDYQKRGMTKAEWIAEVWKQIEADAKKAKKKQPVIHPGTGEVLTAGMQIMFKANLSLDGKPLEGGDSPVNKTDRFQSHGFIKTGLRMPPIMPQDALRGDMSLGDQVAGAVLPFYAAASLQAPTVATFYSPTQRRDYYGRWVETGAERKKKGRDIGTIDNLLDPKRVFPNAAIGIKNFDGLFPKSLPKDLSTDQHAAIVSYQQGGHTYINGLLRNGEPDYEKVPNAEVQEIMPAGIRQTIARLDSAFALEGMTAPVDFKVYRGLATELPEALVPGQVYLDKGFVSTTRSGAWLAERFGKVINEIEIPKGVPLLNMDASGHDFRSEHELLLPRNAVLVYMGESTYTHLGSRNLMTKDEVRPMHRWRYLGQHKDMATFSDSERTDTTEGTDRYVWQAGDLIPIGMADLGEEPANFYSDTQLRGRDGRWVETGAEERNKAQRTENRHLDPNALFKKYEPDYESYDRLVRDYDEKFVNDNLHEPARKAVLAYQNGAHRYVNGTLRRGEDWSRKPTEDELTAKYNATMRDNDLERARAKYTGDMLTEVMEEQRQSYIRRYQAYYDDAIALMPGGVAQGIEDLDDALASKGAKAPHNMKVYRGIYGDFMDSPTVGDEYTDPGFISTSLFPERAYNFGDRMNVIEVPEGTPALYLRVVSTNLEREHEVLLPRDSVLVYMGEEKYSYTTAYGLDKGGTARRWRYLGTKPQANFSEDDQYTEDHPEDGKFCWREADLRRTGKTYRIPPPRMPQDAPTATEKPDNPPTGINPQATYSRALERLSVVLFGRVDQRRDYYGRWADEGKKKIAQAEEAARQAEAEKKKLEKQAFTAENVMAQRTGGAAGSNNGGFYKGADGVERYVKIYDDDTQAYSEILANEIYRELGVPVPKADTFTARGMLHYASTIIPGSDIGDQVGTVGLTKERADMILDGFVGDVLTANRDVLGLNFDNVIDVNGKIYRIDNGSAFLHRAQGARKDRAGLDDIGEWQSLAPGGRNQNYAQVFRTAGYANPEAMGDKLEKQLRKLKKLWESMGEGGWAAYMERLVPGMDQYDKQAIARMLESRTRSLVAKTGQARFYRRDQRRDYYGKWIDEGRGRLRAAATISPTASTKASAPETIESMLGMPELLDPDKMKFTWTEGWDVLKEETAKILHKGKPPGRLDTLPMREQVIWDNAVRELKLRIAKQDLAAKRRLDSIAPILGIASTPPAMSGKLAKPAGMAPKPAPSVDIPGTRPAGEAETLAIPTGTGPTLGDTKDKSLKALIDTVVSIDTMLPETAEVGMPIKARHVWRKAITELELKGTPEAKAHADAIRDVLAGVETGTSVRERQIREGTWDFEAEATHIRDSYLALPEQEQRRLTAGVESLAEDAMHPYINPATTEQLDKRRMEERSAVSIWDLAVRHHMTVPEYVEAAVANLKMVVDQSTLSKRTHLSTLKDILADGRVKTQYETGRSSGSYYPEARAAAEYDLFNYPSRYVYANGGHEIRDEGIPDPLTDPSSKKRPAYGYLVTRVDQYRTSGGWEGVDSYGDVDLVLKDSVRERTTFVGQDSLGLTQGDGKLSNWANQLPAPVSKPNLRVLNWEDNDPLELDFIEGVSGSPYTEIQVHGGITLDDIEYVVLPEEPDDELKKALEKHKLPWILSDQSDDIPTLPPGMTFKDYTLSRIREKVEATETPDERATRLWRTAKKEAAEAEVEDRKKREAASMEGTFSVRVDGDTVRTDNTAFFYRVDQRRDKGKFADEGRGRRPGQPQVRHTGETLVQPGQSLVDKSDMPNLERKGVRTAGQASPALKKQIVELTKMGACDTPYNMDCMQAMAGKHGFTELAEQLGTMTRASWFTTLVDAAPDLQKELGIEYSEDRERIRVNLGITPYRGKPASEPEETQAYYNSTRYQGWLTDLRMTARENNVKIEDVVKVTGVWQGSVEPSASVWLNGDAESVQKMAKAMGSEYNQEGVMLFSQAEDDGIGALYTMPGITDRKKAIEAMQQSGVDGARLVESRDGTYALEVTDFDGSMHDKVVGLSKRVGTETFYTPGKASLLFGGTDYERRSRPHKGRGKTYASRGVAA